MTRKAKLKVYKSRKNGRFYWELRSPWNGNSVMGEVTEMMLDGTLCQCCGAFVNDHPPGYPVSCKDCKRTERRLVKSYDRPGPNTAKTNCPTCGKRVKKAGLADHQRDAHGTTPLRACGGE